MLTRSPFTLGSTPSTFWASSLPASPRSTVAGDSRRSAPVAPKATRESRSFWDRRGVELNRTVTFDTGPVICIVTSYVGDARRREHVEERIEAAGIGEAHGGAGHAPVAAAEDDAAIAALH